jgi:hypothetical protein
LSLTAGDSLATWIEDALSNRKTPDFLPALLMDWSQGAVSQEPLPDKYALLVGVTKYAKPELNTGLKFPDTKQSYFCLYDTAMKAIRDKDGKVLFNNDGTTMMGFVADSMLAIDDVLVALGDSLAANRILVADCCRFDPNRARGRSFGSSLAPDKSPIQTLMLLGCSSQERSLEHDEWGHGALTKCLLDQMQLAQSSQRTMGSIAEEVIPSVKRLVASNNNGNDKQTQRMLQTGRVEILLSNENNANPPDLPVPLA